MKLVYFSRIFIVLSLVLALFSAIEANAGVLVGGGGSLAFEYGPDGRTYETRQPFALRGGYRFDSADFYLEYSSFSSNQSTSFTSVERTHNEWLLWARHVFISEWIIAPYGALGLGYQNDVIHTTFADESSRDKGGFVPVGAAALGLQLAVIRDKSIFKTVDLNIEGRLAASENYSPNPRMSLAFSIESSF